MVKWKILIVLMLMVLIPTAISYYSADSNFKTRVILSGGGMMQNDGNIRTINSVGQLVVGNYTTNRLIVKVGIWYLYNQTNQTPIPIANISVILIHPNSTESNLANYIYNITWEIQDEVGNTNSTLYLVFSDGTKHKIYKNITIESQKWDVRGLTAGYYKINVSVTDSTNTLVSDESTEFYISQDKSRMEIAIIVIISIMAIIFMTLTIVANKLYFKLLFLGMMLGSLLVGVNIAKILASDNGVSAGIISMLNSAYYVILWTTYVMALIIFILGIYKIFNLLRESGGYLRSPKRPENKENNGFL